MTVYRNKDFKPWLIGIFILLLAVCITLFVLAFFVVPEATLDAVPLGAKIFLLVFGFGEGLMAFPLIFMVLPYYKITFKETHND